MEVTFFKLDLNSFSNNLLYYALEYFTWPEILRLTEINKRLRESVKNYTPYVLFHFILSYFKSYGITTINDFIEKSLKIKELESKMKQHLADTKRYYISEYMFEYVFKNSLAYISKVTRIDLGNW
jgi:hypothetical protein